MVQRHIFLPPCIIFFINFMTFCNTIIQQRPNSLVYSHIYLAYDDVLQYQEFHGSQKTNGCITVHSW